MVVDVETHDWKEGNGLRDGRIVEIAWMVFDRDMKCLESRQYLLKPYGYDKIARKATAVHGITTEHAVENGVESDLVFNEFTAILNQLPNDGFVIAHNMEHEDSIFKCNLNEEQQVLWGHAPKCDTWDIKLLKFMPEEALAKYKGGRKSKLQWRDLGLGLSELHYNISPETHTSHATFAHYACTDVDMTWEIFRYYKEHATVEELTWTDPSVEERVKSMFYIREEQST